MTAEHVIAFTEHHRDPHDHVYLLLDALAECSQAHPLSIASLQRDLGESAVTRVPRPDLAHTPTACPALVQLAAPGAAVEKRFQHMSARYAREDIAYRKRYICGWLLSHAAPELVAQHIAAQCRIASSNAGKTITPWFEPVRLELLTAALGHHIGGLLTPIRAWLFPTSWDSFAMVRSTPQASHSDHGASIRNTQHAAQLVNDFLGVWRLAQRQILSFAPWRWSGPGLLPPQAGTHAFRLVRDAQQLGLRNSRDIITLSLHRVCIHPLLAQHAQIQHAIVEAAKGAFSLESRFETYDDAAWKRIYASLPRAANYS